MIRRARIFVAVVTLTVTPWCAMALHESGHVIAALLTGGRVVGVDLVPWHFSRTDIDPNPHPLPVVWAGPLWGAAVPLTAFLRARFKRWRSRPVYAFFAGFCLVGNGAYLAFGWIDRAGDAGDLLRLGTPPWAPCMVGGGLIAAGFWCWHTMGSWIDLLRR